MKRLLLAAALLLAAPAFSQTLTFTVETSSADGRSVIPRLTWSTSPAASSCQASGASNWSLAKQPQGTVILPAITTTTSYSLACAWAGDTSATVRWTAPTQNTDGDAASYFFARQRGDAPPTPGA